MNPFSALAELAIGAWKARTWASWLRLLFCMGCSGVLSFLFVCGSLLAAPPHSWPISIGTGMVVAAVCMTVVFRRSPLTKGLLLVLPSQEALKEIQTDIEVIEK